MAVVSRAIYSAAAINREAVNTKRIYSVAPINQVILPTFFSWDKGIATIGSVRMAISTQKYSVVGRTYAMSGFDSTTGNRVYWTSQGEPNLFPMTTSPILIGTLEYPHIIGVNN